MTNYHITLTHGKSMNVSAYSMLQAIMEVRKKCNLKILNIEER